MKQPLPKKAGGLAPLFLGSGNETYPTVFTCSSFTNQIFPYTGCQHSNRNCPVMQERDRDKHVPQTDAYNRGLEDVSRMADTSECLEGLHF